ELERRAAVLEARLQAPHAVEGRLIIRLGHFQPRLRRVVIDLRQEAPALELLRAAECRAGIVAVGRRLADRRDLIVGRGLAVLRAIDAELRLDLAQRALGALGGELELARLEPRQHVAGPDVGAELHRDLADDAGGFAADPGLIRRGQRAGE